MLSGLIEIMHTLSLFSGKYLSNTPFRISNSLPFCHSLNKNTVP
jgi:hypothetical protein